MHTIHEPPGRVLFDDCSRCTYQSLNLHELDESSLQALSSLAGEVVRGEVSPLDLSGNDVVAVNQLRLQARIVFRSGIDYETAR